MEKYLNTHLDLQNALDCPVALGWFWKAFQDLTNDEQQAYMHLYPASMLFELGALTVLADDYGVEEFYTALADAGVTDINPGLQVVKAFMETTEFAEESTRVAYELQHSKGLMMLTDPVSLLLNIMLDNLED